MEHRAAGLFELADDLAGIRAGGLNDPNALVDDGVRVGAVIGGVDSREDGEVDAEGVLRHGAASADFLPEVVWGRLR